MRRTKTFAIREIYVNEYVTPQRDIISNETVWVKLQIDSRIVSIQSIIKIAKAYLVKQKPRVKEKKLALKRVPKIVINYQPERKRRIFVDRGEGCKT